MMQQEEIEGTGLV